MAARLGPPPRRAQLIRRRRRTCCEATSPSALLLPSLPGECFLELAAPLPERRRLRCLSSETLALPLEPGGMALADGRPKALDSL